MRSPIAGIHVWGEWDNWWDVSHRYTGHGANWIHIIDANPQITNPNVMVAGTRVMIPKDLVQ